jgi:hypothetical protein
MLQPDIRAYMARQPGYDPFFNPLRLFHLEPPYGNVL